MDGNSNPCSNYWTQSHSGSYAVDARIRLETLKSGSSSPVPTSSVNGSMYSYNYSKDIWEIGLSEVSALDSLDLIDVERLEDNEESWLYVSPKGAAFVEPAVSWCRHVLDNRTSEMEAACRQLINRLNLKLSCQHRSPGLQQTASFSFDSSVDQTFFSSTISSSGNDDSDQDMSSDSRYRLQNITDVYDMARIQEASLRQEYVSTPKGPESPLRLPPRSNTTATHTSNIIHRKITGPSYNHSSVPTKTAAAKQCLSPKVTKLHQYKELKRAQNQGSSSRTSSPLRTSLRSLQAVRSSRSLDIDDFNLDQILHSRPGVSPAKTSSVSRSSSHLTQHLLHPDSSIQVRSTAIKRCQRSHSLSPCRIPHPPPSSSDRGFASPQISRAAGRRKTGRQLQK